MNYVSLFSSAGIGCYGFLQEGFDCIATSELIERRLQIQKYNNKVKDPEGYILGDITEEDTKNKLYKIVEKNSNNIDVVIFTAPCQGMSVANHKKNDGTIIKNSLVVEALEIIKELNPKYFIAENVRSFMNTKCIDHNKETKIENAFNSWLSDDYNYESQIINFKDYGANSSRTRTLVIGVRNDISVDPKNLFPDTESVKTLENVIGHLPKLTIMGESHPDDILHNFKSYRKDMRNWIKDLKPGESAFVNKEPENRPHKIINGEIIENVNKNGDKYKRQKWNKVAPCIHTRNDILASQNTIHPEDDRVFSIRELMLLMNIPNEFKWTNLSYNELNNMNVEEKKLFLKKNEINIRQSIGEAIPTIIVQKIAKKIKECDKLARFENK
ncbi:DNA cytosine methyltransferase [Macrococcus epidermidis]|uniref:DNA cytosine methyltransferase n=1 Tax=Macrococcus epidermidis TaxID=1902580 RepID=UPI0020B71EBE|nr:DNA cytosine methyltransferase [Macrococcus epidermidis]UTH15637.1 DNA cytosine methyltransferase [Macrococcus epidermidis]